MKISVMISTLNEAELLQEYLEDQAENTIDFQCTMPKARVEDVARVIGKLVRFIKDCDM